VQSIFILLAWKGVPVVEFVHILHFFLII